MKICKNEYAWSRMLTLGHGHGMQRPPALALVPVSWVSVALLVSSTRSFSQVPFIRFSLAHAPAVLQAISAVYRDWLLTPVLFHFWSATHTPLPACPFPFVLHVEEGRTAKVGEPTGRYFSFSLGGIHKYASVIMCHS
jgi:hypothetical protein